MDEVAQSLSDIDRPDRRRDRASPAWSESTGTARPSWRRPTAWRTAPSTMPNTVDTRFGLASGGKGFTALAVVSLIEDGVLSLDTTARSILGADLPLIDDRVTIEHLLAHRSGIGDYIDEDDEDGEITDYVLAASAERVHRHRGVRPRARRASRRSSRRTRDFSYCNGGFMVLALHRGARQRDRLPPARRRARLRPGRDCSTPTTSGPTSFPATPRSATSRARSRCARNIFHLPVLGSGDGGIYSTADGHARVLGRVPGRRDRLARMGGEDDHADGATCPRRTSATGSASGSTSRRTR